MYKKCTSNSYPTHTYSYTKNVKTVATKLL